MGSKNSSWRMTRFDLSYKTARIFRLEAPSSISFRISPRSFNPPNPSGCKVISGKVKFGCGVGVRVGMGVRVGERVGERVIGIDVGIEVSREFCTQPMRVLAKMNGSKIVIRAGFLTGSMIPYCVNSCVSDEFHQRSKIELLGKE